MSTAIDRACQRLPACLAIFLILGCSQSQPVGAPMATGGSPSLSANQAASMSLLGRVTLPGQLASGQILPTGIGSVIHAGNAGILPTGQGSYRVLEVGASASPASASPASASPDLATSASATPASFDPAADWPVEGAMVVLRDPTTRRRLPGLPILKTDTRGAFRFPAVAVAGNVLIEVFFFAPDNRQAFRLLALARATGDAAEPRAVSWRSTAVTDAWLANPANGDPATVDLARLVATEAALGEALGAMTEAKRAATLGPIVSAAAGSVPSTGGLADELPLPALPSLPPISPSQLPAGASPSAPWLPLQPVASALPAAVVNGAQQVLQAPRAMVSAAIAPVTAITSPLGGATQAATSGVTGLLPAATSPSAATPTAAPTAMPSPVLSLPGSSLGPPHLP